MSLENIPQTSPTSTPDDSIDLIDKRKEAVASLGLKELHNMVEEEKSSRNYSLEKLRNKIATGEYVSNNDSYFLRDFGREISPGSFYQTINPDLASKEGVMYGYTIPDSVLNTISQLKDKLSEDSDDIDYEGVVLDVPIFMDSTPANSADHDTGTYVIDGYLVKEMYDEVESAEVDEENNPKYTYWKCHHVISRIINKEDSVEFFNKISSHVNREGIESEYLANFKQGDSLPARLQALTEYVGRTLDEREIYTDSAELNNKRLLEPGNILVASPDYEYNIKPRGPIVRVKPDDLITLSSANLRNSTGWSWQLVKGKMHVISDSESWNYDGVYPDVRISERETVVRLEPGSMVQYFPKANTRGNYPDHILCDDNQNI
ncbi:hypothetical protein KC872_02135 [Candidatus Kaiserbacteria bacterium]|nr:hypothetical protein [Candidatus Kaiserbacteria bacterium]